MTIVFSADHAGIALREPLLSTATAMGWTIIDLSPTIEDGSVDYPDYAQKGVQAILSGAATYAILVCGTGIGMSMAANRYPGIRAALCHHEYEAQVAKEHNHANILCLGARVIGPDIAQRCLEVFLTAHPQEGRHNRRVEKIDTRPVC